MSRRLGARGTGRRGKPRRRPELDPSARLILDEVVKGYSFEQILTRHPALTLHDLFRTLGRLF